MDRVKGKTAIVTGAASGIGAACARLLAREGAAVAVADRLAEPGQAVAAEIVATGGRALYVALDVASEESWKAAIARTRDAFGGLHILVNNAAVATPAGSVEELGLDDWRAVMGVNLDGVFLGTKFGIEAMRATGHGGSIINFSSTLGHVGSPTTAAYVASKGGVRQFSKSAALHCAKQRTGIRVNTVVPSWIRTKMSVAAIERLTASGRPDPVIEQTPMGRLGEPEEVAWGVLFLASDESSFMTGTDLVIDGGYLAQ